MGAVLPAHSPAMLSLPIQTAEARRCRQQPDSRSPSRAAPSYLGLAVLGWGGRRRPSSPIPALGALTVVATLAMAGAAAPRRGKSEHRACARTAATAGSSPPSPLLGLLDAWLPAWADRQRALDHRWRCRSLARRRPVRGRRCAAAVAGPCARPSVQRAGPCHPAPQLSRAAAELTGMGPCVPLRRRRDADGAPATAAPCPHPRGGKVAAVAIRRRIRELLRPHIAAASRALLAGAGRKKKTARQVTGRQFGNEVQILRRPAVQSWPSAARTSASGTEAGSVAARSGEVDPVCSTSSSSAD